MISHKKMTISGNIIDVVETELPFSYGYENKTRRTNRTSDPEKSKKNREQTVRRSKARVKKIISTNHTRFMRELGARYFPIFITLTSRELITDLTYFNREFSKYISRLNYLAFRAKKNLLKYLVVIEFQKRGAIHYHALFFNMPYIKNIYDRMRDIWEFGSSNIKTIKDLDSIPSYVTKYMTKEEHQEKLARRKSYFTSRGLSKPVEIKDERIVNAVLEELTDRYKVFEKENKHEYYKTIKVAKHKLPYDHPLLKKID